MRLPFTRRRPTPPVGGVRHSIPSWLLSADDDLGRPDAFLIDLAIRAITLAQDSDLGEIAARDPQMGRYVETWPGEHYRLLAGLVQALAPKIVVEIGTATGASALCLLKHLPEGSRLATFDIVPWQRVPGSILRSEDFSGGRMTQYLDDVTTPDGFDRHAELLKQADFIFADAAKDGTMEKRFLDSLLRLPRDKRAVLLFDDTRVPNMIAIWRSLGRPKLDLTSFGHWSGTGLTYLAP
jgi:predicted O-methyltransferase YrrM